MRKLGFILFFLSALGALQSCNYNTNKIGAANTTNKLSGAAPNTLITYELIRTNATGVCLRCHDAGGRSPDLSTRENLILNQASMTSEISTDDMPLNAPALTACQKAILQKWFDLGAPEESTVTINSVPACAAVIPPVEPPVAEAMISYDYIKTNSVATCLHCHKPMGTEPFLNTKADLFAAKDDVTSELSDDSMPMGAPPLTACQKETLQKWFDLGGPDESTVPVSSFASCAAVAPSPPPAPITEPEILITYSLIKTQTAAVCLNCHSAGGKRPELSTKEFFSQNAVKIMSTVTTNKMPKGNNPPLTACQKATLKAWLDLGAPETSTIAVNSLPECLVVP